MSVFSVDQICHVAIGLPRRLRNVARIFDADYYDPANENSGATSVALVPSRFSDPEPPSYGVLYAAEEPVTALYESVIRDNYQNPAYRVTTTELKSRFLAYLNSSPLTLVRVYPETGTNMRLSRNAYGGDRHGQAQAFSSFVHEHMPDADGFEYASTITGGTCVAVFERSLGKLSYQGGAHLDHIQSVLELLESKGYLY